MYVFLCLVGFFVIHVQAYNECTTPHGEPGTCISISMCPRLLNALANPVSGNEEYLMTFMCYNNDANKRSEFFVCCGTSLNFTILNDSTESAENLAKLSDRTYCGMQHKDDMVIIDDDNRVTINEFPWAASLLAINPAGIPTAVCSGSLISAKFVLTSSKCITSLWYWDTIQFIVRLGDFHKKNVTDYEYLPKINETEQSTHEDFDVEAIIPHPFYNNKTGMNNILLMKLKNTVSYSDYIRPICLPIPGSSFAKPGQMLHATSIGAYKDWMGIHMLKLKTNTTLVSNEQCDKSVHPYMMCTTRFPIDTDPEEFEGSPLMFSVRSQWHIEGIICYHMCCSKRSTTCYNTRVSQYLPWIYRSTRF